MRILFIGDIVGKAGRQAIAEGLEKVMDDYQVEFTVANGENAAGGMGMTPVIAIELLDQGVDRQIIRPRYRAEEVGFFTLVMGKR